MYVFLKSANSNTKNGIKQIQKCLLNKHHMQRKLEKTLFERYQKQGHRRGLPNLKKQLYTAFYLKTSLKETTTKIAFLSGRESSAKNSSLHDLVMNITLIY